MEQQESTRQQKFGKQIQKDLSDIFIKEAAAIVRGVMVSVTKVRMSPDLSSARVYISIFPFAKSEEIAKAINAEAVMIRHALGTRVKNQMRHVPNMAFYVDDSLEYIENIDSLLRK